MNFECHLNLAESLKEIELIAKAADVAFDSKEPDGRIQGNAMTRAALVLLCGYFEGFVRDVVEEYIEIVNEQAIKVDAIPDFLFCAVIDDLMGPLRGEDVSEDAISAFKAVMRSDGIVRINKKKFSKTGGNPTVDTIETIFRSLGIPEIIDVLSIRDYEIESTFIKESQIPSKMREEIKSLFVADNFVNSDELLGNIIEIIDGRWSPKQKRRKVGYVNEIEQLLKKRNRIAHGEGHEQITPAELREFLTCIEKLTTGLHSSVVNSLENLFAG